MAWMSKLLSLNRAIERYVSDGAAIAMGCALESLIPFAASKVVTQVQRKKELMLIGPDLGYAIRSNRSAAGCVKKIIASSVSNVAAGLEHNYRRAAEVGIPEPA